MASSIVIAGGGQLGIVGGSLPKIPQQPSSIVGPSSLTQALPSKEKEKKLGLCLRPRSRLVPTCSQPAPPQDDSASGNDAAGSGLDRRHLLMSTSSLGLVSWLPSAVAAPISPPDLRKCETPINPGGGVAPVNCCLPVSTSVVDFKLPQRPPVRVRRAAHLVTPEYAAKYNRAYDLLRKLPANDPRQMAQQANVHCAFCDGAYSEGGQIQELQVHNSWLFFPWHRWYLYFHERMLAKLLGDDTFTLPFWNWDSDAGSYIPSLYIRNQALVDRNRDPRHQPPTTVDLNYSFVERGRTHAQQVAANYATMYRQVVSNAKTPSLFLGLPYRAGDEPNPGGGSVEGVPHGPVHTWTGNPNNPNAEDMGALYSASRDPIFFAHHANVDRLWEVWKSLGGRRVDYTDPDWLNATFIFYDENAQLVRVRIGDSLDPRNLGYIYEAVNNPWIESRPTSRISDALRRVVGVNTTTHDHDVAYGPAGGPAVATAGIKDKIEDAKDIMEDAKEKIKEKKEKIKEKLVEFKDLKLKKLEGILKSLVKRRKKVKADDYEEEILVIKGVEVPTNEKVKFDIYINMPKEGFDDNSPLMSEYAGSFYNLPHLHEVHDEKNGKGKDKKKSRKSNFRIGIGEVLRELGIEDDDDFSVTLVPRVGPQTPVVIDDIEIEYE